MSISVDDFGIAIERLHGTWHELKDQSDWGNVQILMTYGATYLRITRQLLVDDQDGRRDSSESGADVAVEESDDEALPVQRPSRATEPRVIYHIVHSTSYQVPVLYLTFQDFAGRARPSPSELYALLVPDAHQSQIKSVGTMGALSTAEHPMTGTPAYFIHPCRTQEAMAPLLVGRDVEPEQYLMLWLGLIGGSVGLNVPVELAQRIAGSFCVSMGESA